MFSSRPVEPSMIFALLACDVNLRANSPLPIDLFASEGNWIGDFDILLLGHAATLHWPIAFRGIPEEVIRGTARDPDSNMNRSVISFLIRL
jgi:hypothetical protein